MAEPEVQASLEGQNLEAKPGGIKGMMGGMGMGRILSMAGAAALAFGGFIALMLWINTPADQVLFSNLDQADAAKVVEKLKELKVPYTLEGGGSVIKVAEDQVYETRLALASSGLPQGSGIGFEVFNEVKMGTTEFVQKINYQRALQGELARTIVSLAEVAEARVHIVLPQETLFIEDEKEPTAAVVLKLATGRGLKKQQIQGIVQLVAASVPDLTDAGITVVDTKGNLLFKKDSDDSGFPAALTASQLEYQRRVEGAMKEKVQTMLERFVGQGRAVVRVTADIDFTQTVETQEIYNPDQVAVRSETRNTSESNNAGAGPTGSPDQRYTLAAQNANPNAASNTNTKQESETTNFEISRTQKQVQQGVGGLKKVSVAVVVDGPYTETTDAEGNTTRAFAPRAAEEIRQITELVRRTVGYNETRGDEVTVANVPFNIPTDLGTAAEEGYDEYLKAYGPAALNLILGLLFILLVARPLIKAMTRSKEAAEMAAGAMAVGPGEELPEGDAAAALLDELAEPRQITTRDQIMALVQQDPDRATSVLRSWIKG